MRSKLEQPEHVPTSNINYIGSKNYPIRRILALRDSLFILKDDGVFRLTGNGGSWNIDPIDVSTKIIAPDSAVVMNNQIFCLSDQGIVTVSDIGVQVISRPIEDQITDLISASYDNLKKLSFGMAYDTDRKYYLYNYRDWGLTLILRKHLFTILSLKRGLSTLKMQNMHLLIEQMIRFI